MEKFTFGSRSQREQASGKSRKSKISNSASDDPAEQTNKYRGWINIKKGREGGEATEEKTASAYELCMRSVE
jgi:hypothetical protein